MRIFRARSEVVAVAWVTTIGPDAAQIDYRLQEQAGCSLTVGDDVQVTYRMESDRPLEWIGEGLREVGIEPGTVLDDAGKAAARTLSTGRDPRNNDVLVEPKLAVDPRAKLPADTLVDAIAAAADAAGRTPAQLLAIDSRAAARYARIVRGIDRERDAHRVPVADLQRVAKAAGVRLDDVYDPDKLAAAREHADARVRVGNRGYDLTLDLPKSYSVLTGLASPELAGELEDVYLTAVRETVTAMQGWAGYGMRGEHGNGHTAERVDSTGLLGWMTVHRTARPVAGQAPDPHLHAHVTLLNMVKGVDGQWSTVGAGGRDIHRHAHAADAYMRARLRSLTHQRWGMPWARDPRTGAWEVAAVPADLRARMSKRHGQIDAALQVRGLDRDSASTRQQKVLAAQTREAKQDPGTGGDLRAEWRAQALAAGVDPDDLVAQALPGVQLVEQIEPVELTPGVIAEWVFRPADGLTGHRKVTTRADVLAAVLDTDRAGIVDLATAEHRVDQVLADPVAVRLPAAGATHLSNAQRYTTADVVDAEHTVLQAARAGFGAGVAVLDHTTVDLAASQFEAANGFTLSAEQRAVLDRLTTGGHAVDTVIGVAGSGKTTIMAALRAAYEARDQVVMGASTAAVAAANLKNEAGIESRTVASWLARLDAGDAFAGVHVLVVDEAAMVDDRHAARLLTAAAAAGTKVVGIGDPMQLKAVGVGGTFAAVHELTGGLYLTENRRQRDLDERTALAQWRTDARRTALQTWADTGRVHVHDTAGEAQTAMLAVWNTTRQEWDDPHERIAQLVMLAHTNADVAALNAGARALRVAAGELSEHGTVYPLAAGGQLQLAVGEQVLLRVNDHDIGVLNGYRGIVAELADDGRARVQWRSTGPDGPGTADAWLPASYITAGGLSYGYAMTAAKAQGLTAQRGLVYGTGMEANVLYPAMSRDRVRADLWLARTLIEDPLEDVRRGAPATDAEALQRTVNAYADRLKRDLPDRLVTTELGDTITLLTDPARPERQPAEAHGADLDRVDVVPVDEHRQAPIQLSRDESLTPAQRTAAAFDDLAARLAAIGDAQLAQRSTREQLRERLRLAALDPTHRAEAEQRRRQQVTLELRNISAGAVPSGEVTRAELENALQAARTTAMLRDVATATQQTLDTIHGMGGRAERVPAGATAGYVPWQDRPHGHVTGDLNAKIAQAEDKAADLLAAAERREQRAAETRRMAEAGQGPRMRELQQRREQLAAKVAAAAESDAARAASSQAWARSRAAHDEQRRLQAERQRNPIALRLAGTSRGQIDAQLQQLQHTITGAVAEANAEQARAQQIAASVNGLGVPGRAAAELADLTTHWEQRAAQARQRDAQGPLAGGTTMAEHAAAQDRRRAAAQQRRAAGLRAEAQVRDGLDPHVTRHENAGRREHAIRQAEIQAAERQAAAEVLEAARYYDRDGPDLRRGGPSLGM